MDHPIWTDYMPEPARTRGGHGPGLSPLEILRRGLRPTGAILFTTLATTPAPARARQARRRFVDVPEVPRGGVERRGLVRRGVSWLLGR